MEEWTMIRRGWMEPGWEKVLTVRVRGYALDPEDVPAVALPAADFDRLLALLEECAGDIEAEVHGRYSYDGEVHPAQEARYDRDMDLPRRVRALLKEVGDG